MLTECGDILGWGKLCIGIGVQRDGSIAATSYGGFCVAGASMCGFHHELCFHTFHVFVYRDMCSTQ
jgi:hypothetical protein